MAYRHLGLQLFFLAFLFWVIVDSFRSIYIQIHRDRGTGFLSLRQRLTLYHYQGHAFFFFHFVPSLSLNFQSLLSLPYLFILLFSLSNLHRWRGFFIIPTLFFTPSYLAQQIFFSLLFVFSLYHTYTFFIFVNWVERKKKK
ncbi:hypothetical protein HDV63DRAFT_8283 [Trichoderma sp. SZMC 28014]